MYMRLSTLPRLLIALHLTLALSAQAKNVITIPPAPFKADKTADYFTQILRLALDKTAAQYGETELNFSAPMYSTPLLLAVSRPHGAVDLIWTGSSNKREQLLNPIRVPLIRGILGVRSALMHKRMQQQYQAIKTVEDLQQFSVCQGQSWPDGEILEANGVTVKRFKHFEPMIEAVYTGECDIFLRGLHEAPSEISQRKEKYPDLVLVENILINYPFPMYFFVGNYNPELHQRVSAGLHTAVSDGSLERLMEQHPVTSHLFPWTKWQTARHIDLHNPLLDPLPEMYNSSFWLKIH